MLFIFCCRGYRWMYGGCFYIDLSCTKPQPGISENTQIVSISFFSPCHSLSREEIEMCATEAILAVLMVCIIHIDEPNRIGIWSPPMGCHFFPPQYISRSLTVVKNSHPSPIALWKNFYQNAISPAYRMYNAADTYHKPHSRDNIFPFREDGRKKKLRDKIIIFYKSLSKGDIPKERHRGILLHFKSSII